MQCNQKCINFG